MQGLMYPETSAFPYVCIKIGGDENNMITLRGEISLLRAAENFNCTFADRPDLKEEAVLMVRCDRVPIGPANPRQ